MPWIFGERAENAVRAFFQLRYRLIPYIYSYCRGTYDDALPLVRPLYLEYPAVLESYGHPEEYLFGKEFLVSPITDSTGDKDVYLPPGEWTDYFTGATYPGNANVRHTYSLETCPMFVRSGSIIPMQRDESFSDQRPLDTLLVDVYGAPAKFNLYEDDGISLDYRSGKCAWTPISSSRRGKSGHEITIGPSKGEFKDQVKNRSYEIRLHNIRKPHIVTVGNRSMKESNVPQGGWKWESSTLTATIFVDKTTIRKKIKITLN